MEQITAKLQAISVRERGLKADNRWYNISRYGTVDIASLRPYIGQQVIITASISRKTGRYWVRHVEPVSSTQTSDHAVPTERPTPTAPLSAAQSLDGQAPVSASHNGTAQAPTQAQVQTPTPEPSTIDTAPTDTPTETPEPTPEPTPTTSIAEPPPRQDPKSKGIERIDAIMARIMEAGRRRSL